MALPSVCLALVCGCASDDSGHTGVVRESGWDLHGTARDAITDVALPGTSIDVGFVHIDSTTWRPSGEADSAGAYSCGAIGARPGRMRFSKPGYDTLDVAFADSAVVERPSPWNLYRYDARLTPVDALPRPFRRSGRAR